jgi:anti-sigma regulatory factor (Ser/Thr protein kinase)
MDEAVFWSLPPRPQAVSESRERLRSSCTHLPRPVLDDALLLTSELVTNAVRHGAGEITCRLWPGREVVRLEVSDASPVVPHAVERGLVADSGRGLHIVDTLASRWGAVPDQRAAGKTVWFELDTGLA